MTLKRFFTKQVNHLLPSSRPTIKKSLKIKFFRFGSCNEFTLGIGIGEESSTWRKNDVTQNDIKPNDVTKNDIKPNDVTQNDVTLTSNSGKIRNKL